MEQRVDRTTTERLTAPPMGARSEGLQPGYRQELAAVAARLTDVIPLARGDPDAPTPSHIVQAGQAALQDGYTHYTPWAGLPELRAAISRKLARENGIEADHEQEILVTTGAQEAVFMTLQALLDAGDEVVIADPHYAAYDGAVAMAGGVLIPVPTSEASGFDVQASEIERRITPRTKVIALVDPGNPVGTVMSRTTLVAIAEIAVRYNLWVISDEVYEHFIYDGSDHTSIATLAGMRDRTVSVFSFSKSYAMTGWRLGYLTAPSQLVTVLARLKYDISICAPAATQVAGIAALDGPTDDIQRRVDTYRARMRRVVGRLSEMGFPTVHPKAGFVAFPNVTGSGMTDHQFCLHVLREARVLLMPGSVYGPSGAGHVRVSILADDAVLIEALDRIERTVA